MPDAPSQNDLFLAGRRQAILGANNARFDPAIIDTDGSDVNILFQVGAAMGEEVVQYVISRLNAKSLGTAGDEDLDREIYDRYQLPRQGAQAAVVTLALTRSGTDGFTVPALSVFGSTSGETFAIQNDVAFAENNQGPLEVRAVAQQAGRRGNVEADTITRVITSQADPTLAVNNAAAAAGGRDEETDEAYQARAREFFAAARRGTKEAIEFGALDVGRVAQATAVELLNLSTGLQGYRVQLNIADQDGQSNEALAAEVEEQMLEYRCFGVPVQIVSAIPQYVNITVTGLLFEAGSNTTDVLERAANAILAVVNSLPPGQTLRRSSLAAALDRVDQIIVPEGAITVPAGDIVPTTGTAIRTTRDRISLTG